MTLILPRRNRPRDDMLTTLRRLGLTEGLKLCLDAGDSNSWPGSGGKWLDRSGGGYDFFLGTDATAQTTDPTFNGAVGKRSSGEYFSFDGGDYFSYDTTNESWMKALHKAGAVSFVALVYLGSDALCDIVATSAAGASYRGCTLYYSATNNKFQFTTYDTTPASVTIGSAGPDISASLPGLFFVGLTTTIGSGSAYTINVNGVNYSDAWGAFAPSVTDPTYDMKIGSLADANNKDPSGTRLHALSVWQGTALTADNLTAIWNSVRSKYGL